VDPSSSSYIKKEITNAQDFLIKDQLDHLELQVMLSSTEADPSPKLKTLLEEFETLWQLSHQTSPRSLYGKSRVLDLLAHEQQSNTLLEKAIQGYVDLLSLGPSVPAELFKKAGKKCSQLMEFRGWTSKAIQVQKVLAQKFPETPEFFNKLGLLYLLSGNEMAAKESFQSSLQRFPANNFALAHLGLIVTTQAEKSGVRADLEEGVRLLQTGLATKEKEVLDGRFFLHLGDGLRRLGKSQEADLVFQDGAELSLYPSFWQRSLYNVEGLTARPQWTLAETGVEHQLANLVHNWEVIRDEALEILRDDTQKGFTSESENLADTGHWSQFELFRQGSKDEGNCLRAPVTCDLVAKIPEIATNKRGQVKFSLMKGGTHAHAHAGPTNCRLRAHLALSVLPPKVRAKTWSGLRVADKFVTWTEGEMFVFDDSFDHEVWNESEERVVLIVDLWHPGLTQEQRDTLAPI
jgi:aspartate beta-hydroxylase